MFFWIDTQGQQRGEKPCSFIDYSFVYLEHNEDVDDGDDDDDGLLAFHLGSSSLPNKDNNSKPVVMKSPPEKLCTLEHYLHLSWTPLYIIHVIVWTF